MISAGDLQQARARARIRNVRVAPRSICRRESGTALVHNKPPLFPPYFLFLFFLFFLFFFFLFVVVVVSDMRSSSQKIIVRYFLQIILALRALACALYRESSAREIIIRHFLQCMHILHSRACPSHSLPPSLPLSLSLSLSRSLFLLSLPLSVYTEGARVAVLCESG